MMQRVIFNLDGEGRSDTHFDHASLAVWCTFASTDSLPPQTLELFLRVLRPESYRGL